MVNFINPLRPNSRDEGANRSERSKPNKPPQNDDFRKSMDERRSRKDEEEDTSNVEERDDKSLSLFDLSKSSKPKGKIPPKGQARVKSDDSTAPLFPSLTDKKKQLPDDETNFESGDMAFNQFESAEPEDISLTKASQFAQDFDQVIDTENAGIQEEFVTPASSQGQIPVQPQAHKQKEPLASPFDALRQSQAASAMQQTQKTKGLKEEEGSFNINEASSSLKKNKSTSSALKAESAEFKGDGPLAFNSPIQLVGLQTEKTPESQEVNRSSTIAELATEIIDRIQIMQKGSETQTTITLRNPPVLEGATITLTTSDHAKREFNISFANLSPDAKLLLDRKLNEDSLTETLERKGIIVHMLTTTTQAEPLITAEAGQTSKDQGDQQQQQQQQQEQQKRRKFQTPDEKEVT